MSAKETHVKPTPRGNQPTINRVRVEGSASHVPGAASLERMIGLAKGKKRYLILTHDNPDPDAMASAAGTAFLLKRKGGIANGEIAYGGIIGRAENRALVRHLNLPMVHVSKVKVEVIDLVALVDTQYSVGNHSLPTGLYPQIVIDHHPPASANHNAALTLVSSSYGSTSSMVTKLIRLAKLEPDTMLATALFYGVKSDTRALGRGSIPDDEKAYRWLFQRSDHELLSKIEHPQVPISYFAAYYRAFDRAEVFDRVIMAHLGPVYTPDIVPEIAERLLSLESIFWSVATGRWQDELYISVRTNDRRRNAGRHMRLLTKDLGGSAGGHGSMAGARIPLNTLPFERTERIEEEIQIRFKESLGVANIVGMPLIPKE